MDARLLAVVAGLALLGPAHAQDAARGAQLYEARCGGCHSVDANRIGPRHAGVLGRRAGSLPDFTYSPALARSSIMWSAETLERWLTNPEALIPGQRMNFRVADAQDRRDLVAYLATLPTPRP